jgi:hypothetical protein
MEPKISDNGEMYFFDRIDRSKVFVDDSEKWKSKELKDFDAWMVKIDDLLIELYKKPYNQFEEIEKIVFNYQLHANLNEK